MDIMLGTGVTEESTTEGLEGGEDSVAGATLVLPPNGSSRKRGTEQSYVWHIVVAKGRSYNCELLPDLSRTTIPRTSCGSTGLSMNATSFKSLTSLLHTAVTGKTVSPSMRHLSQRVALVGMIALTIAFGTVLQLLNASSPKFALAGVT